MTTTFQKVGNEVRRRRGELSAALVDRELARHPELEQRYEAIGREESLQDAGDYLSHLSQALTVDNPELFTDYVAWAKVMLAQRSVLASDLTTHLDCMADVLEETLSAEPGRLAAGFVRTAVRAVPGMPEELPTFLHEGERLTPLAHQYLDALRRGERHLASSLVLDAVGTGTAVREIYLHVFQPVQWEIGRLWQMNLMTVAEEHYCTAATQLIISLLYPHVFASEKNGRTLVATCVAGDLHEVGVRMVADFFEMDGWNTFYLGANTPHASVMATVIQRRADILAISATIASNVDSIDELIDTVRRNPGCAGVKILVGGYPFNRNPKLWRPLGADGSAADAQQAIALANGMVESAA